MFINKFQFQNSILDPTLALVAMFPESPQLYDSFQPSFVFHSLKLWNTSSCCEEYYSVGDCLLFSRVRKVCRFCRSEVPFSLHHSLGSSWAGICYTFLSCIAVGAHLCYRTNVKVRGYLWELILFFYHVGTRDQTQVVRLLLSFSHQSRDLCFVW